MEDLFDAIKARYPGIDIRSDVGWLIAEVERLRAARIADLNELAEGFELTSRSSVDGLVFQHCAKITQNMAKDIELGARP